MSQRRVLVPDIGEVILAKRRGSRSMRLSINAKGQVRLGMPYWTPYEMGLVFIKSKSEWIQKNLIHHTPNELVNGSRIGKAHRLHFYLAPAKRALAETRVTATTIQIKTALATSDPRVQKLAMAACERALKLEASQLLPMRVSTISQKYGLDYKGLTIRKLTSRWGSCSTKHNISLSYFLIQLPWELIDYVILHELAHTKFLNHSRQFWAFLAEKQPNLTDLRRQLKQHKPRIEPH